MDYNYYQGVPDTQTLLGVLELHKHVFEGAELETEKLKEKSNLIVFVAKDENRVTGFKIGYDYGNRTFYSWLGGVHTDYRGKGIAKELMRRQHELVKSMGYTKARTISRNDKRGMLILNIKFGFDVIETFISKKGTHKIVLEKVL